MWKNPSLSENDLQISTVLQMVDVSTVRVYQGLKNAKNVNASSSKSPVQFDGRSRSENPMVPAQKVQSFPGPRAAECIQSW